MERTMSAREGERAGVLARVVAGLCLREGAELLAVGYRQAKRLLARYRAGGARALVHRAVGRPSNRGHPAALRARVLELVRGEYDGPAAAGPGQRFGPTLVSEHLASEHGLAVPVSTLRRWLRAAGLWSQRRRCRPHRQRRPRAPHFGELVQLDGSWHDWFEGRGPAPVLLTMIDDDLQGICSEKSRLSGGALCGGSAYAALVRRSCLGSFPRSSPLPESATPSTAPA